MTSEQLNVVPCPKYTEDNCYKILCDFAHRMDLEIIYKGVEYFTESVLAYAEAFDLEDGRHKCIVMPTNTERITEAGKEPAVVLAHEITHYLIDEFYTDNEVVNRVTVYPLRLMLENDCDRMGLAIYLLAEAIASEEDNL